MNSKVETGLIGSHPVEAVLWKRIYLRLRPYWKAVVVAVVLMSCAVYAQMLLVNLLQPLMDKAFSGREPDLARTIPLQFVGLFFVRGICNFCSDYLLAWAANNMLRGMRQEMFEHLLGLPDEAFRRGDTKRLLNRFTIDAGNVTGYATEVITVVVRESLIVIASICYLLYISRVLTLIVLVMVPPAVLIARIFMRRLRKINRQTVSMNAELTRAVSEGIGGQRIIKLFDGYEYERGRFHYINSSLRRFAIRGATAEAAMTPLIQMCIASSVAVVIMVALNQANAGALTAGGFVAFFVAVLQIFDPLKRLTGVAGRTQRMLIAAESVFALIDQSSEKETGKQTLPAPIGGKVEFVDVSYRFPDGHRNTLSNVSFTVHSGETVALVGRSGSGKTTLVNMLPRFVHPTRGQIRLDGVDIHALTLNNLRSHLSLVSQDVVLFDDTIAANVGYGVLGTASDEQVIEALEAANLLDFVMSLPQGIRTPVGEHAIRLSGGQRQRLAIARALIKNAPILILDEATSALDNESERQVQASLERLVEGRTTLVIAHRLSTVQNANRIIVLNEGQVIEQGSHKELLALNGLYATLYQMQFRDA